MDVIIEGWAMCWNYGSQIGLMGMGPVEKDMEGQDVALSPTPARLAREHG